jgi:hypothetical protein
MNKSLEQLAVEESLLEKHHIFSALQGSMQTIIEDLKPPRKSKADYEIAKGEIGHCYILLNAVEHIEKTKCIAMRQILDFYKKQIYGASK